MDGRTELKYLLIAISRPFSAAQKAIDGASLVATDIDGIVTVSSTGLAVPHYFFVAMFRGFEAVNVSSLPQKRLFPC